MAYKLVYSNFLVAGLMSAGSMIIGCSSAVTDLSKQHETGPAGKELETIGNANRIRLEHVAINVKDPEGVAKWYCENLGMKIVRKGPAPVNARFICDARGNMMLEVYNNPPDAVPDYPSMNPLSLHIAFMVDDVKETCRKLIAAGATLVDDISVTESGDEIAMLRDPWGLPIQFVKRAEPMLLHK